MAAAATAPNVKRGDKRPVYATPIFTQLEDPLSPRLSSDAIQLAEILGICGKVRRVLQLNKLIANPEPGMSVRDMRDERSDLKFEILEVVEETRLQVDFVLAEIGDEQVILEEAERIIGADRDNRVNRANQLAFRTNGALWAVAEALSIPTYRTPALSVPSGAVGIIAGIVPSLFSGYATRSSSGGRFKRQEYPNILTKICDIEPIPRVEFPEVVWKYLLARPANETRSRKQIIFDHWVADTNMHVFRGGVTEQKLRWLTGNDPYTADLDLVADKLLMMGQLKTVLLQMSRPLLEICMALRGKKHIEPAQSPAAE